MGSVIKEPILKNKLRIYTAAWNDKYIDLFEKTVFRSFSWPDNLKTLKNENVTWSFYTNKESSTKLLQLAKRLELDNYEVREVPHHSDMGVSLLKCFSREIEHCLSDNAKLLLAPPDSLFGDGSLKSIFELGSQPESCVAVAHPRVLNTIFEYPEDLNLNEPVTNSQLVSASFRHLHRSWSEAQYGYDKINSYVGGVMWRQIKKGLYSIQHRLPTNYLMHFTQSDLQFFTDPKRYCVFGDIDHLWPMKLIEEQRQRVVGSSDLAFICEVTDKQMNIPPNYPLDRNEPDRFWRNAYHNKIFRQFNVVFRGVEL